MKDISLYEKIPSLENNFTVKFNLYRSDSVLIPHWHEHLELLYFTRGDCDFFCDGKKYSVHANDLIFVNSAKVHSYTVRDRVEYFCILIYPEFLADIKFNNMHITSHIPNDGYVKSCFDGIAGEADKNTVGTDMMLKSYTYSLLAHLCRAYRVDSVITEKEHEAKQTRLRRLDTVMDYISRSYTEKITTKALSDMCYLSEAHFCRFFKKAVGKSAIDYIREYRIDKASVLLKNTDESICSVAANVGFDDLNYFSRCFKRQMGTSPLKYRRKYHV